MRVRLAYIAPSRFPSRAANSFQVMKMAECLGCSIPLTTLIAVQGDGTIGGNAAAMAGFYGVGSLPALRLIKASGRFAIHIFNLRAALSARMMGAGLVLSRSIGAAALAGWLGIPTIWECHAPPEGFERIYWALLIRSPGFRRLVVISDALKRIMIERHPEAASLDIVVAHDGVDLERFAPMLPAAEAKRRDGRDPSRLVAAYAGHLYAGRGIDVIIACAAALPDWTFLIAGGLAEDIAALRADIAKRGLANIELLGFVDNSNLPERLASADVLLMPYQRRVMVSGGKLDTARWMSPLKMFEYLAMRRAIVASDLDVLREVLDERVAILAVPDDSSAWIAALNRLAGDIGLRNSLSETAASIATHYTWQARIRRMLDGIVEAKS
jgi:glycosyltransferase involved in cell wall biosynthesis